MRADPSSSDNWVARVLMSALRARCPDCRTLTAVAIGPGYQCHSCGREFSAGLLRVPRAWGAGGEAMAEAAALALPWPEAAVVAEPTLAAQIATTARELPQRPLVLGGCCCAHVGAVRELARRHGRIGVVWIDAHGDLNTPETSPSGNAWGMPLRMLIDAGDVAPEDVVLARRPQPRPARGGVPRAGRASGRSSAALPEHVYVALDCDVFAPGAARRVHAGAGRPVAGELERAPRRASRPRRCGASPASRLSAAKRGELAAARATRSGSDVRCNRRHGRGLSSRHVRGPDRRPGRAQARSAARPRASTRTPARSAGRTTATTSSRPRSGCAATAATTSRCGARARIDWYADHGLVRRGGRGRPLGRPARLLRPAPVRRAAGRGRAEHRARRGGRRSARRRSTAIRSSSR